MCKEIRILRNTPASLTRFGSVPKVMPLSSVYLSCGEGQVQKCYLIYILVIFTCFPNPSNQWFLMTLVQRVTLLLTESSSRYGGLAPQQVDSNFLLLMCFLQVNSKLICCFQGAGREGLYVQTEFIAVVAALLIWWSANNVKSKLQESQAGSIGLKFLTLSTTVKHFFFVFNKTGYKNKNFE